MNNIIEAKSGTFWKLAEQGYTNLPDNFRRMNFMIKKIVVDNEDRVVVHFPNEKNFIALPEKIYFVKLGEIIHNEKQYCSFVKVLAFYKVDILEIGWLCISQTPYYALHAFHNNNSSGLFSVNYIRYVIPYE